LKHTPELREFIDTVEDATRRSLVEEVLDRFERRAGPALPGVRAQLIHNDLTLDNVLLDRSLQVSGIVDFGDLTHTALICDLAVSLVSLMWGRRDPLEAAEAAIGGYTSIAPIEDGEADVLADLVPARLAALVVIANWRVRSYPENAQYIRANEELAWALLGRLEALGPSAVERRMHAACAPPRGVRPSSRPLPSSSSVEDLVGRRQRVLGPALSPLSYDRPLLLERAEGINMFDREGNPYLDAYNNVPVVGHSHPRVAEAIAEQTATLNTNTRYLHESVVELGERLVATMPEGLDTVMFVNSGSEANDVAWRFATAYSGGAGAIVSERAYHGVTTTTLALSPEEWIEVPGHVERTPAPDGYRGRYRKEERGWAESYAAGVAEAAAALRRRGLGPAACYMDPLFTSDGIFAPPPIYFEEVMRELRQAGCLFVADEVQAGFGRTGAHLWSFQASGITPDLVTLGKPMGNGYPVAAVVMRSEIAQRLASKTDLFSTFGGNPVACRAALAVLDVIEDEALQHRAAEVGGYLRDNLTRLTARHGSIGDVRGTGLMIGVELVADVGSRSPASRLAAAVVNRMREKGVLVGSTGPDENVLKIRPPLILTSGDADVIVAMLDESLDELAAMGAQGV
ncbi:MAG: aminotransferase class III-fold pyridoxal phosphate-dependent enzyme, partial [Actinomycetota bacterium]|nr:aminotransferase class III-fold pyridoxal phosphate-dependent enzyme [Actinomycetota bacterium]